MSAITRENVIDQLRSVNDPELHKDLVTLNMVKDVVINDGVVTVHIELTTPACPFKDQVTNDVAQAVAKLPGVSSVEVEFSAQVRSWQSRSSVLPGVKHVIAVGAGKGGVGKSTVATLIAVALRRAGASVGLMDADVYGPSIPTMFGIEGSKPQVKDECMVPVEAAGLQIMSIGFMVDRDKPLIWRGPMTHGIIKQFLEQVAWGELDYLIVDLPPGTGDIPLTLAQSVPMTGSVVVCTPQDIALIDARRAVKMYEQLNVPCIGIIENMSYYLCPKCGHRDEIFDHGGAEAAASELGVPFLGGIPLDTRIREFGDAGTPEHIFTSAGELVREAVEKIASALAGQISIRTLQQAAQPTLSIE